MANEPFFSENLTETQLEIMKHYMTILGVGAESVHFWKSQEFLSDLYPIDVAVFEPTKVFNFYTMATVGLSSYYFDKNFKRCELIMVLPPEWKPIFDKPEFMWPLEFLLDMAYGAVDNKSGFTFGMVVQPNLDGKPYCTCSDTVAAVVTAPEMYPYEMMHADVGKTGVTFFQVVTLSKNDLEKIETMGVRNFIGFELHDSEEPLMAIKMDFKKLQGIDAIISHNEKSLKDKI